MYHAFIDTFVSTGYQNQFLIRRQLGYARLSQLASLRRKIDDFRPVSRRLLGCMNRVTQRLNHHQHAGPTTIRTIIDRTMFVVGKLPGVPALNLQQATLDGPTRYPVLGNGSEHFREEANHPNPHKKPPALVLPRETRNQDPNQLRLFEQSDQYA
ncbi:hypothetical protein AERO9A_190006 [Aeromonas salmonicida]|nr:hypothetical protein AERO9A_190006 [Aeromonas salmonicida]